MPSRTRLANEAWEALLSAHATLIKEFAAQDIWQQLSMREYDVLYTLSKSRGPIRLGELNRNLLLSQPALSRMVDRLVERGLVDRSVDPSDGRGVLLSLTGPGRDCRRTVGRSHAVRVGRALAAELSSEELRELRSIGLKLAARGR